MGIDSQDDGPEGIFGGRRPPALVSVRVESSLAHRLKERAHQTGRTIEQEAGRALSWYLLLPNESVSA